MDPSDAARSPRGVRLGVGAAIVVVLGVAAAVIAIAVWRGATAPVDIVSDVTAAGTASRGAAGTGAPGVGTEETDAAARRSRRRRAASSTCTSSGR